MCAGVHRSVQECTEVYRSAQKCTEVHRSVQECTEVYRSAQTCTGVHRSVPECTEVVPALGIQWLGSCPYTKAKGGTHLMSRDKHATRPNAMQPRPGIAANPGPRLDGMMSIGMFIPDKGCGAPFVEVYRSAQKCTGVHKSVQECTEMHRSAQKRTGVHRSVQDFC